ncbi:hypothetical protein BCM18_005690, partial [Clostridium beijerinckii]|nr:hypothetical protein [Clostridium beijerinckii]
DRLQGETKLVRKFSSKKIKDIYAKLVRYGDEFEEGVDHGKPYVNFKPKPFNNDDITGVFAVVITKMVRWNTKQCLRKRLSIFETIGAKRISMGSFLLHG